MKYSTATGAWIVIGILLWLPLSLFSTSQPAGMGIGEIVDIVKGLGKTLEWTNDKIGELVMTLQREVEVDWYKKEAEQKAVTAVFVYRATEAGLVLKIMKGSGLVTFKDGPKGGEISLRSTSVGAHIGGSAEWGVGLVMGTVDKNSFGGEYSGSIRKATAVDSSTNTGVMLVPPNSSGGKISHQIYLVTIGRGLSAGTGGAKIIITPLF